MIGSDASARFSDGKEPGAMRTIGEVASALGIRQHVLRYWEAQFPMLKPLKRSGGRRYYRPEDVALVERIDQLVNREGYTLRGARQALEVNVAEVQPATRHAASSSISAGVSAADLLPQLRAIRVRLAEALQA
jgi:DNA-binding transcriptional MerR regulator